MSKSLKNFITIKEILKRYSSRQIRFLFLLHQWDAIMDYAEHSMQEVIEKERQFLEFLKQSKALMRILEIKTTYQKWSDKDYELNKLFTDS